MKSKSNLGGKQSTWAKAQLLEADSRNSTLVKKKKKKRCVGYSGRMKKMIQHRRETEHSLNKD